jgi:predicted metal-dependent hydrolase
MRDKLAQAISLFNRHAYFESHEILETMWQSATEEKEKVFYESLIRFATGMHLRHNRRNRQGAINLLTQGLMKIEEYRPTYLGIDVGRLYDDVTTHVETLKATENADPGFLERWRVLRIRTVG